ncbi:MAG TPA: M28 family peptidase [Gemmatimonadaceae bacterium]|nr:M28 family peptidase [Gemmatimonadaceae bacterium]
MKQQFEAASVLLLASLAACATGARGTAGPSHPDSTLIRRDIAYLASDALEGRLTGTAGNDSAAVYIARRYKSLGLKPLTPDYLQRFEAVSAEDAHAGRTEPRKTENVIAVLPGTDPTLRGEYVVIGAHFDHLGRSSTFAQDPEAKDAIRNGADDNASGTAAVLELARLFRAHPTRRSIVFANFSGEELGLLGSQWFVSHPPVPIQRIVAMINFDMVGRLASNKLIVYGTGTASELASLLDSANTSLDGGSLTVRGVGDGYGPSDQTSFYAKDIPVLHFFTDQHEDYHRATDDVEKINAAGEARIVDLAMRVVRSVADRPSHLTFVRMAAPSTRMGSREGSQTYLGSVPDMSATDVVGMRLMGVRPDSPADKGGLKTGDVIVEFGGTSVKDLYSYTDALYAHKPGDVVKVVVMRGTQRVELSVTLGKRGQ